MEDRGDLSLGMTAEDFYNQEKRNRTGPVEVARRLADITIPSVFAPEDWDSGDDLEITNQSINARAVNTLTNKLTLAALPPNLPMAKFNAIESKLAEDIKRDPELWSEVQYALSRREENHRERLETTTARTAYSKATKLNLVTGNALVLWTNINRPRVYNMHQYVVKRDAGGEPLVTVLEDCVSMAVADEDVLQAAQESRARRGVKSDSNEWDEEIKVYHVQKLLVDDDDEKEWVYWQEVEGGELVEDSEAYSEYDVPAMMPSGLNHETGSDWYLPYCLDYEGDLMAVENFAASLQDGAAALAWFLFFVDPTGHTNLKDVQDADSLDVLAGRADDVTALQSQKGGDLATVDRQFSEAARRLGFAFAMVTSIQRPGERVTAEEWENMVREIDEAMGGTYTQISQGLQRWFVLRFIHLHEMEDEDLQQMPQGLVSVGVVTGLDSIGQATDHGNLLGWAAEGKDVLGPEQFAAAINSKDFLRRLAGFRAVKIEGLVKTEEQTAADNEAALMQNQQATILDKAAGPIAKEGAGAISEMIKSQVQEGAQQDG